MSVFEGITQIILGFQKYASTDADHNTISKKELGLLLKEELGGFTGVRNLSCLLI